MIPASGSPDRHGLIIPLAQLAEARLSVGSCVEDAASSVLLRGPLPRQPSAMSAFVDSGPSMWELCVRLTTKRAMHWSADRVSERRRPRGVGDHIGVGPHHRVRKPPAAGMANAPCPRRPPTTTTPTGRLQAASPYAADASTNGRARRQGPGASGHGRLASAARAAPASAWANGRGGRAQPTRRRGAPATFYI